MRVCSIHSTLTVYCQCISNVDVHTPYCLYPYPRHRDEWRNVAISNFNNATLRDVDGRQSIVSAIVLFDSDNQCTAKMPVNHLRHARTTFLLTPSGSQIRRRVTPADTYSLHYPGPLQCGRQHTPCLGRAPVLRNKGGRRQYGRRSVGLARA